MSRMRSMTAFRSPRSQQGFSLLEIIIVLVLIGGILVLVGSRVMGGADENTAPDVGNLIAGVDLIDQGERAIVLV